jgi:hypothetical protein
MGKRWGEPMSRKLYLCLVAAAAGLLLCGALVSETGAQFLPKNDTNPKHPHHKKKPPYEPKKDAALRRVKKPAQPKQRTSPATLPGTSPKRTHPRTGPGPILPHPSFPRLINPRLGAGLGVSPG